MTRLNKQRMIRWKLKRVMDLIRISNRELAQKLGKHETSVSRMKNSEKMPRMGADEIGSLCDALNDLYEERGFEASITPNDLLEYTREDRSARIKLVLVRSIFQFDFNAIFDFGSIWLSGRSDCVSFMCWPWAWAGFRLCGRRFCL